MQSSPRRDGSPPPGFGNPLRQQPPTSTPGHLQRGALSAAAAASRSERFRVTSRRTGRWELQFPPFFPPAAALFPQLRNQILAGIQSFQSSAQRLKSGDPEYSNSLYKMNAFEKNQNGPV
ncbi:hypothetical protein F2P81_025585 [Scophthalmus maximus]|uniref:Uncharacterized protein n=1 Tax=Scophthalmus maximus TaxID=52904 RepID=A0A6A4RS18_SCOMX|nr:hypothetical protein F2P81_025585 [Scophthalmus maximus]